jgi:cellulose synthase/poly-beta-1,6-N-acetylglucosamine synthase-like glycosyltransferase
MLWRLGQGWQRLRAADNTVIPVSVTVLVPARNEEQHIVQCLTDLVHQDYPKQFVQILVMDDGSDDRTAELAEGLALTHPYIKVMRLPDAKGKKQALQRGIDVTLSKLIATVDADCRIAPTWLSTMVAHQQRGQAAMVMGPVVIAPAPTLFERIQRMEFLAIMGVTGGAAANGTPVMANGANLLFLREAFKAVGGYSGSSNPSGDDVFLMLKLKERAASNAALGGVVFAKDARALVSTHAMPSLRAFWQQRKRWLSKKDGYTDRHVKRTAILTYSGKRGGARCADRTLPSHINPSVRHADRCAGAEDLGRPVLHPHGQSRPDAHLRHVGNYSRAVFHPHLYLTFGHRWQREAV